MSLFRFVGSSIPLDYFDIKFESSPNALPEGEDLKLSAQPADSGGLVPQLLLPRPLGEGWGEGDLKLKSNLTKHI